MEQNPESNKSRSDLILWLLAAAMAIVLFLLEKTPLWTILLLVALAALLCHPVTQIPWIRDTRRRQVAALAFMGCLVVCFGFLVWPEADKGAAHGVSIALGISKMLLRMLTGPGVRYSLCIVLGMLLLAVSQRIARRLAIVQKTKRGRRAEAKGFLDYKMQTEEGAHRLSPKLKEISNIVANVGICMGEYTKRVQGVSTSSARIQLKRVRQSANMLDSYSRQLDKKCAYLEQIGDPLAEGIHEWLKWISTLPNRWVAKQELDGSLRDMLKATDAALNTINTYLTIFEGIRGVSRDMNYAVNAHLISMKRIRDVIEKIRKSSSDGLLLFEAIEPQ